MKSRVQRWDLVVGGFASLVAVGGLLLSITLGNTASLGLGDFHREHKRSWRRSRQCFSFWLQSRRDCAIGGHAKLVTIRADGVSNVCSTHHDAVAEAELGSCSESRSLAV